MTPKRDSLFDRKQDSTDFIFNERVARVFDDMLDRSVPFYHEVILAIARILGNSLSSGATITDLGCATGATLLKLRSLLEEKGFHYIGLDNSRAMLEQARLKNELFSKQGDIEFREGDITSMELPASQAVILNYTLQFIRPMHREAFLKRICEALPPGGLCILSEKTISHHPGINRSYIDIYHQFKKERGYSELEISQKREALENILIPSSIEENRAMLLSAGFTEVEPFFQWFNFASFIAVKPSTLPLL
jgi:tRNA (cmo5U34)-methyltransferase